MNLEFNEEKHEYFLENVLIPSVSEIIKPIYQNVYKNVYERILENAAERGTKVHRAIEFISKYNFEKFDDEILGYIEAYKKFKKDYNNWTLKHSELRTYHKSLLYGMTIDQCYETPEGIVICDIKTAKTAQKKAWSVQLSAYKAGFESQYSKVSKIVALQLFENGKYKVHDLKDNFQIFLYCLEIHKFWRA